MVLLRLSVTYGILPSELATRMSVEDFVLLCSYIEYEPLPTNKIDINQAAISSTIAGLFNKVKFEDFMNPWIKPRFIEKQFTEEELREMAIKMAMAKSEEYKYDANGNKIPYRERYEYFNSGKANGVRTVVKKKKKQF